jgi:methionine-S-sulfoxide reductase
MARQTIYFAGGCFWGLEDLTQALDGVLETEVGYMGGKSAHPSYEEVCSGTSGHAETVRVFFDDGVMPLSRLLDWFFRMHDPTTLNRQGNDSGTQYRSAIFLESEKQRPEAEAAIERAGASGRWSQPIVTKVESGFSFYSAEEEHQKYLQKHPGGYSCHYIRD